MARMLSLQVLVVNLSLFFVCSVEATCYGLLKYREIAELEKSVLGQGSQLVDRLASKMVPKLLWSTYQAFGTDAELDYRNLLLVIEDAQMLVMNEAMEEEDLPGLLTFTADTLGINGDRLITRKRMKSLAQLILRANMFELACQSYQASITNTLNGKMPQLLDIELPESEREFQKRNEMLQKEKEKEEEDRWGIKHMSDQAYRIATLPIRIPVATTQYAYRKLYSGATSIAGAVRSVWSFAERVDQLMNDEEVPSIKERILQSVNTQQRIEVRKYLMEKHLQRLHAKTKEMGEQGMGEMAYYLKEFREHFSNQ